LVQFGTQRLNHFSCAYADAVSALLTATLALAVIRQTGSGRNQSTNDDVFLQAAQIIALTGHRAFGQYAGGFLEGGSGNKAFRRQRRLGDSEQYAVIARRELLFLLGFFVFLENLGVLHLIAFDQGGVTRFNDLNLPQHLTYDDFDVLVVDHNALQTVNVLDFVNDVLSQLAHTQQTQNVVRVGRSIGNHLAFLDLLAFEHVHLAPFRNQHLIRISVVARRNDQTFFAFSFLTEAHGAGDFRQDGRFFRLTSFEQVGNPRQTTGNIPSLGAFLGNPRDDVTDVDPVALTQAQQCVGRQEHLRRRVGARQFHFLAILIDNLHQRTDVLTGCRTVFRIHHLDTSQTRQFVSLGVNGNPFFNPNKGYEACYLGDNRVSMGVPLRHNLTGLDLITCFDAQLSTVGQFIPLALTAMTVGKRQSRRTGNHNQVTVRLLNGLQVVQTHGTAMLHMDAIHGRRPGSRTTDVERTHGQLGTGLTDRLSSNNTDRLTDVHQVTTGQIAAVALGTHSMAGITGNSGAHDDLVDPRLLNQLYQCLIQQGAGSQQYSLIITRCVDVTCSHTSQHSVTQRYNNITTFDQRSDQDALIGTTVNFGDNQVLSHVHQTTGQV